MSTILFPERIKKLVRYIGMTDKAFKKEMCEHYENNGDKKDSARHAVNNLFKTGNPHSTTIDKVTWYFSRKCKELKKNFEPVWLQKDFFDFDKIDELKNIQPVINENHPFYSAFTHYQEYVHQDDKSLKIIINEFCRDYLIYRQHSTGELVQDILRVFGYEHGTALCELYLYSGLLNHPIRKYTGNMFIDKNRAIYLIVSALPMHKTMCPDFILFTFNGDMTSGENLGYVSGMSQKASSKVISSCVLLTNDCSSSLTVDSDVKRVDLMNSNIQETEGYKFFLDNLKDTNFHKK